MPVWCIFKTSLTIELVLSTYISISTSSFLCTSTYDALCKETKFRPETTLTLQPITTILSKICCLIGFCTTFFMAHELWLQGWHSFPNLRDNFLCTGVLKNTVTSSSFCKLYFKHLVVRLDEDINAYVKGILLQDHGQICIWSWSYKIPILCSEMYSCEALFECTSV